MRIREDIKALCDEFYRNTAENNEVYYVKWDLEQGTLPDLSLERAQADGKLARATLEKANALLASGTLSHSDEIMVKVLAYYCRYIEKNELNYWYKFDLNHYTCPLPHLFSKALRLPWDTPAQREAYRSILAQFPGYIRDMQRKMEEQSRRYIRMPVEGCRLVLTSLETYRSMADKTVRDEETRRLAGEIRKALDGLETYLREDYLPHAPQTIGMGQYPGGLEMYRRQVETYISCDADPREIQETGYRALEETHRRMEEIMKEVGFEGTLQEFSDQVEADPRFKFKTPEEMQETLTGYLDKIRPLMPRYFSRMPKADCAVARIDPQLEATTSWGYYNIPVEDPVGVYYYSAAELDKRCQVRANAVIYHELLPGHHYQMNLVLEDPTLPDILHHHYNTACADGWAEYASGFCREIGLYTPYNDYGRLCWDAFLCCRLIVDTGLNALGWTYEEARDFLRKNTMFTDQEIYTELLRYTIGMPAQALSYKWGSLKFFSFREEAARVLGDRFDLREFHDVMLQFGSIPLDIVEEHFRWYLHQKQTGGSLDL